VFILFLIYINAHYSLLNGGFPGFGGGGGSPIPKVPSVPKPVAQAAKSFTKNPSQFGKQLGKDILNAMKDAWDEFKKFVEKYGKPYKPQSKEGQSRFKIFQKNIFIHYCF